MVKLKMIDSSYFDKQNGGQKLNEKRNSLSQFLYNFLITKQSTKYLTIIKLKKAK